MSNAEDPTTELLTQALTEEAAAAEPSPGALQHIQARTAESAADRRRSRRRWLLVTPLGAGLAAAAVIFGVVALNGGSNSGSQQPPIANQPQTSAAHQGVYDPSAPASEQITVWYVGPQPANPELAPRLYAETHTVVDAGDNAKIAAANEAVTGSPIDSDYRDVWPAGLTVDSITTGSGVTTIHFDDDGAAQLPTGGELDLGLQALARSIGLQPGDRFGYEVVGRDNDSIGYIVATDDDVRAFITIDNIVDGQPMSSPVTVEVSGNVFEGNVNWTLLDANGEKVDDGFVTTSMGMWTQVPVGLGTLDPGACTFKALEHSAQDGSVINLDDKTFTVE
jgi:hypothetical protein